MNNLLVGLLALGSISAFAMETDEFYDDLSGDLSALISNPSLGGGILMSNKSYENGVCRALGYERAAVGSIVVGSVYRGPMVIVEENGSVSSGEVATSSSGNEIRQIICLNKISSSNERTYKMSSPLHLDSKVPFSIKSYQNGVCRALGHERAAVGSIVVGSYYRGPMVIVSENGSVSSGEVATSSLGNEIINLVCITKL